MRHTGDIAIGQRGRAGDTVFLEGPPRSVFAHHDGTAIVQLIVRVEAAAGNEEAVAVEAEVVTKVALRAISPQLHALVGPSAVFYLIGLQTAESRGRPYQTALANGQRLATLRHLQGGLRTEGVALVVNEQPFAALGQHGLRGGAELRKDGVGNLGRRDRFPVVVDGEAPEALSAAFAHIIVDGFGKDREISGLLTGNSGPLRRVGHASRRPSPRRRSWRAGRWCHRF